MPISIHRNIRIPSIIVFLIYSTSSFCNTFELSLLTYGPGNNLYSAFGHSALRLIDKRNNSDYVFNYGTFDFDTDNFYLKFVKGKLPYRLSRSKTNFVLEQYRLEGRQVTETPLFLPPNESEALARALHENYKPENREYFYDFFFDNCATRILTILSANTTINFNNVSLDETRKSFRNLTCDNLNSSPWIKLGINIVLGTKADKNATILETAFLPEYLYRIIKESMPTSGDIILVQSGKPSTKYNNITVYIFSIVLLLTAAASILTKNATFNKYIDIIIFVPAILLGIQLIWLQFFSALEATHYNLNILWANPLLIFPVLNRHIKLIRIFIVTCVLGGLFYCLYYIKEPSIILYAASLLFRLSIPRYYLTQGQPLLQKTSLKLFEKTG